MRCILVVGLLACVGGAFGQKADMRDAVAKSVLKSEPLIEDAEFQAYLAPLVARVAAAVPDAPRDWKWNARITKGKASEPRLLPDGTVLLPLELLHQNVQNEAELASLIAHAVSHHAMLFRRFRDDGPLVMWSGDLVPQAALPELREKERKADSDTVAALAASGYDPAAWRTLFLRMKLNRAVDEGRDPQGDFPQGGTLDTAGFQAFRSELATLAAAVKAVKAPTLYRSPKPQVQ